jgi:hypothetical protein
MLHRVRGYALIQAGPHDEARRALEESLRVARSRDARFEIAQTLEALARLGELEGVLQLAYREECAAILEHLGVVKLPEIPLPAPAHKAPVLQSRPS